MDLPVSRLKNVRQGAEARVTLPGGEDAAGHVSSSPG